MTPSAAKNGFPVKRLVVFSAILLVALIVLTSSLYTVQEGEFVYITQFGKIRAIETTAGLKVKVPLIQDINRLTKKQMIYNVNPSEVLTADKKAMIVDSYSIWAIEDVTTFIRTVGNISEMQKRIDASTYSVIKNVMGSLQQSEIISDNESGRSTLNKQITDQVAVQLKAYGVRIQTVEIKRFDLPSDNEAAVFDRMISERAQMAASFKADGEYEAAKIRNETDKQVEILLGEAHAEAQRLAGEAEEAFMKTLQEVYNDPTKAEFYVFARELEAIRTALQGEKTIVLGKDSPLAKILNNQP